MSSRHLPDWLEAYLVYTAESESPEAFHIWTGISAIAGALRRRVYVDMGYFQVYPNMYIVLVSPPGRCKKSTAMRLGRGVLGQVPGLHFSVDSVTRERLIMDLAQAYADGQSAMTAYSSEFASLLTSSGMDMVVFLTDIFDSPSEWAHKTKSSGTTKIKYPVLNLIGATTPEQISGILGLSTVGIGLASRIVFIYSADPRIKPPRPKLSDEQKALHMLLAEDLANISLMSGEFVMTDEAAEYYDSWYMARVKNPNPTKDNRLSGYYERKPVHLLKVAMIVAAAQSSIKTFVDDEGNIKNWLELHHIERALDLFERLEQDMRHVFAGVGKNPLQQDINEILSEMVSRPEGATRGELLEAFFHQVRADELDEILGVLTAMNKLTLDKTGRYYAIQQLPAPSSPNDADGGNEERSDG
jgi:hypothetical protein